MYVNFWDTDKLEVDIVFNENGKYYLLTDLDTEACISIEAEELIAFAKALLESEE